MESFEEFLAKLEKTENISDSKRVINENLDSKTNSEIRQPSVPATATPIIQENIVESVEPTPSKVIEEPITGYRLYRDKPETFICDMEISGANPDNSKARIIIESKDMTYMFEGFIDSKGHCEIPLKKMNFLAENEIGKIKLEVIADDMVFNPWEDSFVAINHKKVTVRVAESIDTTPRVGVRISNIR